MDTAAASGSRELAEDLLYFFVEQGKKECFAACLYTCYDLIRCDVAIELSWVNKMMDCSTPYMLQYLREYTLKIDDLIKDKLDAIKERKELEVQQKEALQQQNMYQPMMPLALTAPPGMMGMPDSGYGSYGGYEFGANSSGMGIPPPLYGMPQMAGY
eukprot:TRINITY_DN2195_c0_g1_i1.p2 TRINITY_DN2195_c0_g1~~TRINITY_DN2195_c0_g1_i1.p2  ORF type:complete len:157 (-),score=33.88 TRINITY_DN2195_c0_g1_i1:1230-1700(-)